MSFDRILWEKKQRKKAKERQDKRQSTRDWLTYFAIGCALCGLFVAPPPFPNILFRESVFGRSIYREVALDDLPFKPVNFTLLLVTSSLEVNSTITAYVSLYVPEDFVASYTVKEIAVSLDSALESPILLGGPLIAVPTKCPSPNYLYCGILYRTPAFSYMKLVNTIGNVWDGVENVTYTVSGTFGATLIFLRTNAEPLPFDTGPLFTIASEETTLIRRSEALTATLTLFILFFAALDIRPAESEGNGTEDEKPYN